MTRIRTGVFVLLSSATFALALSGCSGSSKNSASPPAGPGITSVTPATGTISTIVQISGSSISSPTVTFTSGSASFEAQVITSTSTATSVEAVVPSVPTRLAAAGTVFDVTVANSGGGSTTLSHAFTMAKPTLTDINGGLAGSGSAGSPFIVDGDNYGDPSTVTSVYSVDFTDPVTSTVYSAAVASGDWTDTYVVAVVPNNLTTGNMYNVTVRTPSGTSDPRTFQVVGGVLFSPSNIAWAETSSLPAAQQGFSTVIAPVGTTSFIYAIGGNIAASGTTNGKAQNVKTVYMNRMDGSSGALADASWTTITPLPEERGFAAAVVANTLNSIVSGNGNIYVLGGLDPNGVTTTSVYYASLSGDGTIPAAGNTGTWTQTTPLPQALFAEGAVLFHGRIYVVGGNDSSGLPVAKVYSAKINADGTLADWQTLPDMPQALAYHQLVTSTGYLYALGGDAPFDPTVNDTVAVDPITSSWAGSEQSSVYYSHINIRNGAIAPIAGNDWTTSANQMTKPREKFTAIAAGDYVLVSGGLYGNSTDGSSEESYAQLNTDSYGATSAWLGATGSHTVCSTSGTGGVCSRGGEVFYNHSAAYFVDAGGTPHVLLLGGGDLTTSGLENRVWYQTN